MLTHVAYWQEIKRRQDRQILSNEAQRAELGIMAGANDLKVAAHIRGEHERQGAGPPVFNDMLRAIERGEANAILTWKSSTASRATSTNGEGS